MTGYSLYSGRGGAGRTREKRGEFDRCGQGHGVGSGVGEVTSLGRCVSPLGERTAHYGMTGYSLYSGRGARGGRGKNAGDYTDAGRSDVGEVMSVGRCVSPLGERTAHYGITGDSLYSGMGMRGGRGKDAGEGMTNAERSRPVEISGVGLDFDFRRACHPPLASGAGVVVGHKGPPPQQHRGGNTARVRGGLDVELLVVNPAFGPVFYWMTNVQSEVVLVTLRHPIDVAVGRLDPLGP